MKLKELLDALDGIDPEIEVVVQTRADEDNMEELEEDEVDGLLWKITDDRSFEISYGKLHIIADYVPSVQD